MQQYTSSCIFCLIYIYLCEIIIQQCTCNKSAPGSVALFHGSGPNESESENKLFEVWWGKVRRETGTLSLSISIYLCIYIFIYHFIYISIYESIYVCMHLFIYLTISIDQYIYIHYSTTYTWAAFNGAVAECINCRVSRVRSWSIVMSFKTLH